MDNTLFTWDELSENPKTAPKKLLNAFKHAGAQIVASWVEGKIKRENGVSYRQICLVFADSQQITLRVKQTGDVFQVRLNKKVMALKEQNDIKQAIIEIIKLVDQNTRKFQRTLTQKRISLPSGMKSTIKRKEIVLAEREKELDQRIEEAKAMVSSLLQGVAA